MEEGGEEMVDDKVEDGEEGEYEVTTRTKYGVQCTVNIVRRTIYVQCASYNAIRGVFGIQI